MLKIWAKTINEDKITRDLIFLRHEKYFADEFMEYLVEICYELDIPTPMVLKSHVQNFAKFNVTRFKKSDFVESIDFESLVLENAST